MTYTPFDSPALREQSKYYPLDWYGKVPKRVRMNKTVRSDVPIHIHWIGDSHRPVAIAGTEFDVWVNRSGAVSVLFLSGETLGLRPDEFTIIEWHEKERWAYQCHS